MEQCPTESLVMTHSLRGQLVPSCFILGGSSSWHQRRNEAQLYTHTSVRWAYSQ
jgi:hypothetical protein